VHPRLLQFGHVAIPTYGALTALALVVALAASVYFARRLALDPNKVWNLCLTGTLTTLIGARLLLVVVHFSAFRQHPFWIIGLTGMHDAWIAPVSVLLGIAAAILYALAEGLPLLRVADCLAPAITLAFTINRIGAYIAGLDFGTPATLPWSVVYTSRLAALWYHTPLGVPLHPIQLYDAAASLIAFAILVSGRHRRQDGELAGFVLILFGPASSWLRLYRANQHAPVLSLTLDIVILLIGGALWLDRRSKRGSYTSTDDSPPV